MTEEERLELLAELYNSEPDEPKTNNAPIIYADGMRRSRRIVIGAVSYDVPSVEYVSYLEQKVVSQGRNIDELRQIIRRIDAGVNQIRHQVGQTKSALQNKIDRSDWS